MLEVKETLHVVGISEIQPDRLALAETQSLMETLAKWFRVRDVEVSAVVSSGSSSGRLTAQTVSKALGGVESFVFSYLERVLIEDFDAFSWDRLDRWSTDKRSGVIDSRFDHLVRSYETKGNAMGFPLAEGRLEFPPKVDDDLHLVFASLGFQVVLVVLPSKSVSRTNVKAEQYRRP